MSALPCPNCRNELTLLDAYQRHFCYHCQQYAPEGYGDRGAKQCPACGGILSYVAQYERFFCYQCNAYPPSEDAERGAQLAEVPAQEAVSAPPVEVSQVAPESPEAPSETPSDTTGEEPAKAAESSPSETPEPAEDIEGEERPPLDREEILQAKKARLLDLCKAYDLNPSGTKEQLKERLLSFLDEQEPPEEAKLEVSFEKPAAVEPEPERPAPADQEATIAPVEPKLEQGTSTGPAAAMGAPSGAGLMLEVKPEPAQGAPPKRAPAAKPSAGLTARPAHPCPTCGRELDYIARYDRWYCYSCKSYARLPSYKHACPTCGQTLRWIERYSRWWCDSEQRYAPADLPGPRVSPGPAFATPAARTALVPKEQARPAIIVHRHRNPATGIGLATLGIVCWILYQILVEAPRIMAVSVPVNVLPEVAFLLQFFGFLFLGAGVLLGLSALRDRP